MIAMKGFLSALWLGCLSACAIAQTTTYQAESATLSGVTVGTATAGYTGSGYVEGFDTSTDKITFTIDSPSTKLYDLQLTYDGIYGDKYTTIVLNGGAASNVFLPATTSFTTIAAGQVLLNEGSNTIEVQSNWGWYLVDAILLSPAPERGPHHISTRPVNRNANADARALLKYLGTNYGSKIISGQQDRTSLDWITTNVGKTPAILGSDFMDYTESRISRGANGTDVDKAIDFATKQGGMITFCWHWGAPAGLYDTADHPWYSGFYTDAADFNITTALADTKNANYTLIIKDIDTIAAQLKRLQSAHVPVIFRPLHEAEGGWFWWGAQGPEPCKKLYRLLYDRLTRHHRINNIIWLWNSVAEEWYPGDDVVDMVSADDYTAGHGPISATYNSLISLVNDTKIIAAAEVGSIPDPSLLQAYRADWVYFCTWTGDFITDGKWNSLDFLKSLYNNDYVLTLDEIQGWKHKAGR